MARRAHDPARRGDRRGDRHRIWTRRAPAAPSASVLVPGLRRRHGHGLALVRHHHLGDRRAQARADAAFRRARRACLRRPRRAFAQDAARACSHWRQGRFRRRRLGARQPAGRQGRQRRCAGRLRSLSAWLHRHGRRDLGRRPAGHERANTAGSALPLALRKPDELRRGAACRHRRRRPGRHRQPDRPPRRSFAPAAARPSGRTRAG